MSFLKSDDLGFRDTVVPRHSSHTIVMLQRTKKTLVNTIEYATAARMLRDIADATNAPYINAIAGINLLILDVVQVS